MIMHWNPIKNPITNPITNRKWNPIKNAKFQLAVQKATIRCQPETGQHLRFTSLIMHFRKERSMHQHKYLLLCIYLLSSLLLSFYLISAQELPFSSTMADMSSEIQQPST